MIAVVDPATGTERRATSSSPHWAHRILRMRGALSETLPDSIAAHVHALAAIDGLLRVLVPDNLGRHHQAVALQPGINRTYQDLADHYGCVVLPTRIRHPRDKAKVEVAVQIVERFVLAKRETVPSSRLRN